MLTMKTIIVFIILFVPSHCDDTSDDYDDGPPTFLPPNWGSLEEFLKEVNEFRAKFAKEHRIPNMYKLALSDEIVEQLIILFSRPPSIYHYKPRLVHGFIWFNIPNSDQNLAAMINADIEKFKDQSYQLSRQTSNLISPHQTFIGCDLGDWGRTCAMLFGSYSDPMHADFGEPGSQCRPRFKGENGLCVPVDPSKYTFWGTEEGFMEDVNYMRRKYAKKFGIPNMHQLTWNETLLEVLKGLDWDFGSYGWSLWTGWDGYETRWRITEVPTFSSALTAIDDAVREVLFSVYAPREADIRGERKSVSALELIHPLQTSVACTKIVKKTYAEADIKSISTTCLIGDMPSEWEFDVNLKKTPGSECMDGYVNDDGLCILAPPTSAPKPVQNVPKKPAVTRAPESEQEEEAESSSVTNLSYGLWILYFIVFFF